MTATTAPANGRREWPTILAFGLFSYALLSTWGALVANDVGVMLSLRRLISCCVGVGLFWLSIRYLRQRQAPLSTIVAMIVLAGVTILAVRLGLDQLSSKPINAEHSIRWSLAWSGYFGIWLLAAVPPAAPSRRSRIENGATSLGQLPEPYLEQLFELPDGR